MSTHQFGPISTITFRGPHGTPITMPSTEFEQLLRSGGITAAEIITATPAAPYFTPGGTAPNRHLRNVSVDSHGRVTTVMAGLVLTHEDDCIAGSARPPECSCFISRLQVVYLPDGTPVPTPPYPEAEQLEQVTAQRDEAREDARLAPRWTLIALVWAAAGWTFSVARGILGF